MTQKASLGRFPHLLHQFEQEAAEVDLSYQDFAD